MPDIIGIDYGGRYAGTTAVASYSNSRIEVVSVEKGKDADAFLSEQVERIQPSLIAIDAPLSLPLAYFQDNGDLSFRRCDRELNAMSPMFLGGLTARAIGLVRQWRKMGIEVIEVYPSALVRHLELVQYKKKGSPSQELMDELLERGLEYSVIPQDMHQLDASLALMSGKRYTEGVALSFGKEQEGVIIV